MIELLSAEKPEIPAASAASRTTPAAALSCADGHGRVEQPLQPCRERLRRTEPARRQIRPTAPSPGSQESSRKTSAPTARATAAYWSARAAPKAISVAGSRAGIADQLGDRLARSGSGLSDGEDEAAGDDVSVRRDDAVGGRVAPVRQAAA